MIEKSEERKARTVEPGDTPELPGPVAAQAAAVEQALERWLPEGEGQSERVVEAMRRALLAPGKRLRPILTLLGAELAGRSTAGVLQAAVAVEMIHTASLVLDDLPCMDDSQHRRGQPTLHRQFDASTALLAAEGLLMQAFALLGQAVADSRLTVREAGLLVRDAADCVGAGGMVGGQWRDLHLERPEFEALEYVHSRKTGRLFILSATVGARLLRAGEPVLNCLSSYAKNLGLAFQIKDDLLNFQATFSELGKDVLSDQGKVTFVTAFGLEPAEALTVELVKTAKLSLVPLGRRAECLSWLADYVLLRRK